MAKFIGNKALRQIVWAIWPALATLLITFIIAVFITEFTFTSGERAVGSVLFRFLRLFLNLTLPLFLLPVICTMAQRLLNGKSRQLIRIRKEENADFHAFQSWFLRPLQGIGLLLLMATHFLGPLGTYLGSSFTGPAVPTVPPPGELTLGRFINVGLTSMVLSFVWTMDDLGLRHYNKKAGEIRIVGKYLGSLLPILTGFYGIYGLFKDQPPLIAALMIGQRIVIFYPPLVIFNVLHTYFVNKNRAALLRKLKVAPGVIRAEVNDRTNL